VHISAKCFYKSVALTILGLLAFDAQKFSGVTCPSLAMSPFRKILRDRVRTVSGNIQVKFKVRRFNRLGAISILAPKNLGGHVTLATPPFRKIFKGSCPDCRWKHARQIWSP